MGSLGNSSESPIPFGIFLGCREAWGTAWEKALRMIGDFEKRLGFLSIKFLAHQNQLGFFDFVLLAQGAGFSDPLWKKMATYEDRKFVVMWVVPPYKQPEIFW